MMRQEDVLTWSAASLLLVMLLTMTAIGTRNYRAAPCLEFGTVAMSDRWGMQATRAMGPAAPAARHAAAAPVAHEAPAAPHGRSDALMLLMLLGQGAHPTIGLR